MPRDFTLEGLVAWIKSLQEAGYEFHGFDPGVSDERKAILRHDVDLDLDAAVQVAELEASHGVKSTFFLLVTAVTYNLLSSRGREACRRIRSAGHEIALHFDPTDISGVHLLTALNRQRTHLEDALEASVRVFSTHRPSALGVDLKSSVGGMLSASAHEFRGKIGYSSDSGGWWRYGRFLDSPEFTGRRSVQLLLHPVWWTGKEGEHPAGRLQRLSDHLAEEGRRSMRASISPFGDLASSPQSHRSEWAQRIEVLRP